MMKIMSRNKIALMAVLVAVMMVMSMMAVSAAPVADAGVANESYAAESVEVATLDDLHNAMVKVETEDVNVTATLKENLVYDPAAYESFVVGTDATSDGVLTITGGGEYSITLGGKATLHIKGNVQFENIILDKCETGTGAGDYMNASYIFVTEGKGVFGDNITNPNSSSRPRKISLAGSDIEVYSGQYMVVAANFNRSGTDVDSPKIVFGGNAETENLAGRGVGTGASPKVTGASSVTIQDSANVSGIATAGYFRPVVSGETNFAGNATLTMTSGTVGSLFYAGYVASNGAGDTANYAVNETTRSQYTININGGTISSYFAMYDIQAKVDIKGVDATLTMGNANYGTVRIVVGPWVRSSAAGASVTDCKVTANINGATFGGEFDGGYINLNTTEATKVVFDVDLEYNLGQTGIVTFNGAAYFGTFINNIATYSEHRGDVEVNVWASSGNVLFNKKEFFAGSHLFASYSKHAGSTTVRFKSRPYSTGYSDATIYCGSYITADNAEHSGTSTIYSPEDGHTNTTMKVFGGSKITKAGIHSGDSFVISSNTALAQQINGNNTTVLDEGYVFGGSYLIGANAVHSGDSKVTFGETSVQGILRHDTFGGSWIAGSGAKHTGKSEIVCEKANIQGHAWAFGGSYLEVAGAVHEGASAVTIKERVGTSSIIKGIYGGSYILIDGAKHTGSSTFEFNAGTMNNAHGAGSYAVTMATDELLDDGITGGFAQCGDVYYIVNGGAITKIPNIAGYNVNVDGDINVIITGGTIGDGTTKEFSTLNNDTTTSVSITGDLKLKISGGTINFNIIQHGSKNASAVAGQDVVKGTYYAEFVNNTMVFSPVSGTNTQFHPVGYNNLAANFDGSSVYVRYVGDFNKFAEGTFTYNFTGRVNHLTGDRILDYVQWTVDGGTLAAMGRSETIYRPMNGQTVTIDRIETLGENVKLSDYIVKSGDTLTWKYSGTSISATYDALIKYDYLTDYKNAPKFVDATTGESITVSTTALKLVCGTISSADVALSEAALDVLNTINRDYTIKGLSIRAENLAMRCRVKISRAFFDAEGNAVAFNGYKVSKVGILVSLSGDKELTFANSTDACAWNNGTFGTNGLGWTVDDNDANNYYFAAAITGYGELDSIDATRANKTVFFRGYMELTHEDGSTVVVYLDNPRANENGYEYKSYGRSLAGVAQKLFDEKETNSEVTYWYNRVINAKESVLAILQATVESKYNFSVTGGANMFDYVAYPIKDTDNGMVYVLAINVKPGYNVTEFELNDEVMALDSDNTIEVCVDGDSTIALAFARKDSAELETRRAEVLAKMQQITGVKYTVDKEYTFKHGNSTVTLYPGTVYQGMPYSDNAPFSYEAFMDFKTATNNNVHTMSFTIGNEDFFPGNTCADAIFWSWAKVSSTIWFSSSADMIQAEGVYTVGDFDVQASDITSGGTWADTYAICSRNGSTIMENAYAMMRTGDAMVRVNSNGVGHVILIASVDTANKNVVYYDQNGNFENVGNGVISSCSYAETKSFTELFLEGYLPVTCIELLEDAPLADIDVTDTEATLSYSTLTAGMIETNYALSKIEMVITNTTTGDEYKVVRHGYESPRLKFYFASFNNNAGGNGAGKVENVYTDAFSTDFKNNLPSGDYTCVVTGFFSNGDELVIRDYDFTKQ